MDIPNFKDILQKLSILKSNLSLLAAIIVIFVALLLFIPTRLLSSGLRENVKETSVRIGDRIRLEQRRARSRQQCMEVAKHQEAYANDANEISRLARQSTERELLSYYLFPSAKDTSALIFKEFGQRFRDGIDGFIARINGSDCPTQAELTRGVQNVSGGSSVGVRPSRSSRRSSSPLGGAKTVAETVKDELCLSRAKACSVYVNPEHLGGYEFWREYRYDVQIEEAVKDCWFYQLGYWVIEDVLATIGSMNSGSANVLSSGVKRLVGVSFTGDLRSALTDRKTSLVKRVRRKSKYRKTDNKPSYVFEDYEGLAGSCTGRLTNEELDVIHFNVSVIVDVESILPFMRELCSAKQHKFKGFFNELEQPSVFTHNQITILESGFTTVDRSAEPHELYRYGESAVVKLDLVCEYVFNAKAYDAIKPEATKVNPNAKDKK